MFPFVFAFLLGDLCIQSGRELLGLPDVLLALFIATLACLMLQRFWRYSYVAIGLALGAAWSDWQAHSLLAWTLPKAMEGMPLTVTGQIASLPRASEGGARFHLLLQGVDQHATVPRGKALVVLTWRDAPPLQVGDSWRLVVRLKRIHGMRNTGTFDYETWAFQNHLRAMGNVLQRPSPVWLSHCGHCFIFAKARQRLQEKMRALASRLPMFPWIEALAIGERGGLSPENWQVLRRTGTNHLMAVAGLHIGMMAGAFYVTVFWLWRWSVRFMLWMPAHHAASLAMLLVGGAYSALAGFSLPAQRAFVMLFIFVCSTLARKKPAMSQAFSLAMLIVLLKSPLVVLSESFWLSFGTIALILYALGGRLSPTGWWWKWGRAQWAIGLGLVPLTVAFFQECTLVSFVANCFAVPWLGFSVLPFVFFGSVFAFISPVLAKLLLSLADFNLGVLWAFLRWCSNFPVASWHFPTPGALVLFAGLLGCMLLLLPISFPGRWFGALWLLPLFLHLPERPKEGDYKFTLLDVGQGLSAVVETKQHVLIYDTGPKYPGHVDLGEQAVLPFLYAQAIKQVDMLVISHGDNDHIGGAQSILRALPVLAVRTSVPDKVPSRDTRFCEAGMDWEWDKVRFSFVYPPQAIARGAHFALGLRRRKVISGNDRSCVLLVDNGKQRVLLAGDIETFAEKEMLKRVPEKLSAQVLVAPHHGSNTSGDGGFIAAVRPAYVLYAIGYRNRYHFPRQSVVSAYAKINAKQLDTANSGAITFTFKKEGDIEGPILYRHAHQKYWHDRGDNVIPNE